MKVGWTGRGMGKGASCSCTFLSCPLKPGDRVEEKLIEVGWLRCAWGSQVLSSPLSLWTFQICIMTNTNTEILTGLDWAFFCWKYVLSRLWGLGGFVRGDWGLWLLLSLPHEKAAASGISVLVVWQTWRWKYLWLRKQMRGWFLLKEMGTALSEECSVMWECLNYSPEGSNGILSFNNLFKPWGSVIQGYILLTECAPEMVNK